MAGIKIGWVCLFAVAGFLLTSGEETTTNTIQDQNSTSLLSSNSSEHISENSSSSGLNCTDKVSVLEKGVTQEGFSTVNTEAKEGKTTEVSSSVPSDESVLKENSATEKEYGESNNANEIKLDEKYVAEKTTHGKEYLNEKELEFESTTDSDESVPPDSEIDSSKHNSSDETENSTTYTSSEADMVGMNSTNEASTMTSNVSVDGKTTEVKSTKKRSVDEHHVDTTVPDIDNDTEAGSETTVSITEASSEMEAQGKNESVMRGDNDTSSSKTDDVSDNSFDATSVTTDANSDKVDSKAQISSFGDISSAKKLNVSRKRRVSTVKVDINGTAPTSIAADETAVDEPSSFDFPEHISSADTEIWPDNLPSASEWSSSHMSSSVSASKEDDIEDPEIAAKDISDPLQNASSESNPVTTSEVTDTTMDSESLTSEIAPLQHKSDHMTEPPSRRSSEKVTQPDIQLSSIKTLKITGADMTTPFKTLLIETSSMDASEPIKTSDNENIPTASSQEDDSHLDTAISSTFDHGILPVVHAALREGLMLQPNVFSTKFADPSSEKPIIAGSEKHGSTTTNPEMISSSAVSMNAAKMDRMSSQNEEPEYQSTGIHMVSAQNTAEESMTSASSNVEAYTVKAMPHISDIMLGDQHVPKRNSEAPQEKTLDTVTKATTDEKVKKVDKNKVSAEVVFTSGETKSNVESDQNQSSIAIKTDVTKTASEKHVNPHANLSEQSASQISSNAMSSVKPETSVQVESSTEGSHLTMSSSPAPNSVSEMSSLSNNESLVAEDSLLNRTDITTTEIGNATEVIADSNASVTTLAAPPVQSPISTSSRPRILKPRLRIPGSHSDSPRATPRSIIPTHRPRSTTTGEPVSIFNRKKTRISSITSSTTQRAISSFNIQNIHYADRVPDSHIPLAPGVSLDMTPPPPPTTTTEPPTTTTEEPYSEEPFTDPTQVPNVSNEDDVTLVKMAGTLVIKKGIRWNDQLFHRNSPHYKKISKQMHLRLERLFRTSAIATRLWSIEIDGFSETLPLSGRVMVDFILSLIKSADKHEIEDFRNLTALEIEERKLAAIFNEKLVNNSFGRYTIDPVLTEFKVLKEEKRFRPTEAPGPEPPIPQWAIAVIVIGAASLIFIVLFATVTMYGRHHMRRRYSNKLSEEDIDRSGDWESKMAAAYENLAADTIYDAEDGSIESMKRRQRPNQHARPNARLKRYDSWYSGNITVSPRQSYRQQVHRIVY